MYNNKNFTETWKDGKSTKEETQASKMSKSQNSYNF